MLSTTGGRGGPRMAWAALALATLSALLIIGAPLAYRAGILGLLEALLTVLPAGVLAGLVALAVLLARTGFVLARGWRGGGRVALVALVLALGVTLLPLSQMVNARRLPEIHDISTDTADPPAFVALLADRAGAPNPPAYPGEDVAALQRAAYPDIAAIDLSVAPGEAFARVQATAKMLGWRIVAASEAEGRLEATDTSFWFRFTDDIVVRVRAIDGGSRIDVRSKSRVGRSDLGANANRIRKFAEGVT